MHQRRSKLSQPLESDVRISHQRWPVLIDVIRTGRDDRKAVVGGRHASGLDGSSQHVVDERGFSGRVVADKEDEGKGGSPIGIFGEGSAQLRVDRHYGGVQRRALGQDGLLYA